MGEGSFRFVRFDRFPTPASPGSGPKGLISARTPFAGTPSDRVYCSVEAAEWKKQVQVVGCVERSETHPTGRERGVSEDGAIGAKMRDGGSGADV